MAWKIFSAKKYVRHGLKPILFFTRQGMVEANNKLVQRLGTCMFPYISNGLS